MNILPYVFGAGLLLPFALLRCWRLYDRSVDWVLCLLLSFFAATVAGSLDLGTDAASYRTYYSQLAVSTDAFTWWDPGFELLATLFAGVGAPYGLFVFACVFASHLIKLHVFDRIAANVLLPFFVLFCLNIGEIAFVRQYLSASVVLLGFYFLTNQRHAAALLTMLVAASFHKSALVAIAFIVLLQFRWSMLKPLALLSLMAAAVVALLPPAVIENTQDRIYTQIAAYTVEGFVQGLQATDISLFRNAVKFLLYALLAAWMLPVTPRSDADLAQSKAAHVVLALSAASVVLVALISPVFARLSVYVFPFLALSFRAERFRPARSELAAQYLIAALLLAHFVVALYPLREFF